MTLCQVNDYSTTGVTYHAVQYRYSKVAEHIQ